jgi:predicted Fe-Mo cluster-binding NifX family protein
LEKADSIAKEEGNNMKIAVASDDKKTISHHFGRAVGFIIFEIKKGEIAEKEYRENIGKSTGQCHTCNHSMMINNIKDCESVISHGMGMGIYQDLQSNKIKAIVTDESIAEEAVKKYLSGKLSNRIDRLH